MKRYDLAAQAFARLGGIDQTLLFGFELGRQKSRNERISGTIAGNAPADDVRVERVTPGPQPGAATGEGAYDEPERGGTVV